MEIPPRLQAVYPHLMGSANSAQHQTAGYQGFGSFMGASVDQLLQQDEWQRPPLPPCILKAISTSSLDVPAWNARHVRSDGFLLGLTDKKALPASASASADELAVGIGITSKDEWTFLNHGAFGGPCSVAHKVADAWRNWIERQPLRAVDRALFPHLAHAIRRTANSLGVDHRRVALIPNATTGVNAAFRSARLGPRRGVLLLSLGYGANKTMARAYCGEAGAPPPVVADVHLPLPSPASAATHAIESAAESALAMLPTDCACALVVVDLITSNTGAVCWEAVRAVAAAARRHSSGALVLVDGAHAWGQLRLTTPVTLPSEGNGTASQSSSSSRSSSPVATPPRQVRPAAPLDSTPIGSSLSSPSPSRRTSGTLRRPTGVPLHALDQPLASLPFDFFVTNGHKWLCATRGVAALVVSRRGRDLCVPPVRSHGAEAGFAGAFVWDGCRDYAAALALPDVLDWWERGPGSDAAREHCRDLLRRMDGTLRRAWFPRSSGEVSPSASPMSQSASSGCSPPGPGPVLLPPELHSHLRLVPLPDSLLPSVGIESTADVNVTQGGSVGVQTPTSTHCKAVQDWLFMQGVECPVKLLGGRMWLRLSCHVYNQEIDFFVLGAIVCEAAGLDVPSGWMEALEATDSAGTGVGAQGSPMMLSSREEDGYASCGTKPLPMPLPAPSHAVTLDKVKGIAGSDAAPWIIAGALAGTLIGLAVGGVIGAMSWRPGRGSGK